jgi:predicted DNA-binding protein (UPF0278 family)
MDLLLTEGNIKSEFILYLAKYLDEVIAASDGDVDRAIAKFGGKLDQADKIALKELLENKSTRDEIINIAKKSWGSKSLPTTSDAFNEFVLKIETKLSDDVAKKIVDDSWGLALEKSDDLRDIYDGSINTIIEKTRQHLNEGTSIEEIRKNYKAMLKSSTLFKDKDELVDYLVSRMEKEEKFYKFANENKDSIKGWYEYSPSNILPGGRSPLPNGWESWMYRPIDELSLSNASKFGPWFSWAKYLIRDLPEVDNFYSTIRNVLKKWDGEGYNSSKFEQVRLESFEILNQILNFDGRVIGVFIQKEDEENDKNYSGTVMCEPSSIDKTIPEINYIDDETMWRPYEETIIFLDYVYNKIKIPFSTPKAIPTSATL